MLLLTNQCICLGSTLTYECTVVGRVGATVWSGTAIDCYETDDITFLHLRRFTDIKRCNNGAIIGRGIRVEENCYTSQLNITVGSNVVGQSVECTYNNGTATTLIGNSSVIITSGDLHVHAGMKGIHCKNKIVNITTW